MGPDFRFYVLFLISDKIQKVWYITRCIELVNFKNQKFLPSVLSEFMKLGNAIREETCVIFGFWTKNNLFNRNYYFLDLNSIFKKLKKSRKKLMIFLIWGKISPKPFVRLRSIFCQSLTILFHFQIFFLKFRKKTLKW